ncbi:MAG: tRNA lysidine(34) synthetase TilS [Endomicrobium sp.]|nr:tRNA lysidine(34) synthetase TilS [Endomicrobium sp.]
MTAWDIFYNNIYKDNFILSKDRIILAVSGGIDSICMLHLFWRLSKKITKIKLIVVTFNHNLRNEAINDINTVKELTKNFNIKCICKSLNVIQYSKKHNFSIETAGRELRYLALKNIAQKFKYNKIATAHNANDNAETVIMWLIRGTGNIIGIPQKRIINKKLTIIRPLLQIRRKLIETYVKYNKLPFHIDKSNNSNIYTRNIIRTSIIPIFEKINPKAINHIFNLTTISNLENEYFKNISSKILYKCSKITKNKISIDLTIFLRYNKAIQFRIIRTLLPEKKKNSVINMIMEKIMSGKALTYRLSNNWTISIRSNMIFFIKE